MGDIVEAVGRLTAVNGMLPAVPRRKSALLLLALATAALAAGDQPPAPPQKLTFAPCRLEHPLGLISFEAECGHLLVPETRGDAGSRALPLFVARIPALSRQRKPEPVFLLAGGPGLGASVFYSTVAPAFARIRRDRDIIIVDQRGTGRSRPLDCPVDEQQMWDTGADETARAMRDCRDRLQRDHDLAQYTTSVAVQDLDAVRQALGYARIALYGSSYGTRVAQHYARRHPGSTAALILDGVVPPARALGPSTPLDAEQSLRNIFARCTADRRCLERFGDPAADYLAPDPLKGTPREITFSPDLLAGALRLSSYNAEQAALLPLTLHLANQENQYAPLAAQYLLAASGYDAVLAYGMHNSVVCAEDVPFFAADLDRGRLAETFLGTAQIDALQALCGDWPRGPIDADFHAPLRSAVPALLLSGGNDPVTPASFGNEAAQGFSRSLHLVLPDQGHGQLLQPCVDRIMATFVDAAVAGGKLDVDTSCTRKLRPPPFFLSLNGPAP
jgi:pimeloyl-ACP methyl ester carboxylesterase